MTGWQLREMARFDADAADYIAPCCRECGDDCADNGLDDAMICDRCRVADDESYEVGEGD